MTVPTLTPHSAMSLANDTAIERGLCEYVAIVSPAAGVMIELRLVHYVGKVNDELIENEVAVKLSRAQSVQKFEDACRRAWAFLKLEHERMDAKESA